MATKRCPAGHVYDPTQHISCPHCPVPGLNVGSTIQKGPAATRADDSDFESTETVALGRRPVEDGQTVGYMRHLMKIDPVVGWLVCIDGPAKGRDFRIHAERNFIGRDDGMDVCIPGDDGISRRKHAVISFNPRKNTFRLGPGEGRALVYLNDEEVDMPVELKARDVIELGRTRLMFAPFCGEDFQWT